MLLLFKFTIKRYHLTLDTTFKYDTTATTKDSSTLATNVLSAITSYNNDTLQNFTGVFRHSKLLEAINGADTYCVRSGSKMRRLSSDKTFVGTKITAGHCMG